MTQLDPFTQEIVKDKLAAIADEMGIVLARTSMSPIVYEVLDFACGLTDTDGRVLAQTNGLTLFTGTFGTQVRRVMQKFPRGMMEPGDVFLTNDPYGGGTHVCDICLVAPVFVDPDVVAFAVSITHWIDTGGSVPGSIPVDATEIFQEGIRLPCVRVARRDGFEATVVDIIEANVRTPRLAIGDLRAGTAAVRIGERGVQEICARYGVKTLATVASALLDHADQLARERIRQIPDGVYVAADTIDGDGVTDEDIPIMVRVVVDGDRIMADFTGSARQRAAPINCPRSALESACNTVFRAITTPQARSNDGCFRAMSIVCPEGTVFTAGLPAPTGWYYEASACATELMWKALAPVLPDRLSAGSYMSLCVSYIIGHGVGGADVFVLAEPNNGGWGASADADGESALIATTDGDTYNFPVEVVEARFPLMVERYELNCAAGGGAGRRRGGFGLVREYRVLDDDGAVAYGSMTGARRRPWGLGGGGEGTNNYFEFCEDGATPTRAGRVRRRDLQPGQLVRIVTGTGGGYGHPFDREPDLVGGDIIDGYITVDQARTEYGVVIDPATHALDPKGTAALRAAGRST